MESDLEHKARMHAESLGGRMPKWISPGNAGVPDRILLVPNLPPAFIEFKWRRGRVRPAQGRWYDWLRGAGFRSYFVRDFEQFLAVIDDLRKKEVRS